MMRSTTAGALLAVLILGSPAQAQPYPNKPLSIIVALAAGTGMDTIVRVYSERLSRQLRQTIVVENRPGNAGMATMDGILKATPDGYTLAAATSSALAIRPTLFRKLPYDPLKDFTPISLYLKSPFVLVVNPALPIRSVPELVKYIKDRPGQISFSSTSVGGAPHLAGEYLKQKFGVEMTHVPYRNSPQAIADVAAGHVQLTFAEAGASLALIRDGKLRALAVTSMTRLGTLPDVPPFAEASGIADFEAVSWHVLFARSTVPKEIVNQLHQQMNGIMADAEVTRAISNLGLIPQVPPSIEDTQSYIRSEIDKWGTLVRNLGLAGSE